MASSSAINENVVAESLKGLTISNPGLAADDLSVQQNPWGEDTGQAREKLEAPALPTPVDTSFAIDSQTETPFEPREKVQTDQEVLNEFDPLRNRDEQAAKDAWERSESHPPPPNLLSHTNEQATASVATTSAANDGAAISRPSTPSFPGLAAIARTFSLPRGRNTRPLSIDMATTISSPTISTFAQQQKQTRSQSQQPAQNRHSQKIPTSVSTPIARASSERDRDKDEPIPFDFQKFLDQMKSKAAEPVAKYLRSYVC